jgi:Xaa-Pro aminopeptidase
MQDVREFLDQNSGGVTAHAQREYLDLLTAEDSHVNRRRLLITASVLGKTPADVQADREAIVTAKRLHRQALEIANHEQRAAIAKQAHGRAVNEAQAKHLEIDAEVAKHLKAADEANQAAIDARNALIDLAKLRNVKSELFAPGSPYAGLCGERQPGDESHLTYGP